METNLCVAGFGGQGVMTLGKFLASATCDATNKNVTFFPSYGAEQRGGTANCFVVISDEEIGAPLGDVMDDLIVMNGPSLEKFESATVPGGKIFYDSTLIEKNGGRTDVTYFAVPATKIAEENGIGKLANVIMCGKFLKETGLCTMEVAAPIIQKLVPAKKPELYDLNMKALKIGYCDC